MPALPKIADRVGRPRLFRRLSASPNQRNANIVAVLRTISNIQHVRLVLDSAIMVAAILGLVAGDIDSLLGAVVAAAEPVRLAVRVADGKLFPGTGGSRRYSKSA
jgi:hypothetical protein